MLLIKARYLCSTQNPTLRHAVIHVHVEFFSIFNDEVLKEGSWTTFAQVLHNAAIFMAGM
jgi:hypothetical protein